MKPEIGKKYTKEEIEKMVAEVIGWTGEVDPGYSVYDYFSADGEYLGPDSLGVEPLWLD